MESSLLNIRSSYYMLLFYLKSMYLLFDIFDSLLIDGC